MEIKANYPLTRRLKNIGTHSPTARWSSRVLLSSIFCGTRTEKQSSWDGDEAARVMRNSRKEYI